MINKNLSRLGVLLILGVFVGWLIAGSQENLAILLLGGLGLVLLALTNLNLAAGILIFSMLLSPEIGLAQISGRGVVLRIEDVLLIVIFFCWLVKLTLNRELRFLKKTPLNLPIGLYIFASIFATFFGMTLGHLTSIIGLFYILKYIEYFMLYFFITNILKTSKQSKLYIALFLLVYFIICIYGYSQFGRLVRVTTPFEGGDEPNTLGGYLLLIMGLSLGLLVYSDSLPQQILLGGLIVFGFPVFLRTFSRCSYLGIIPMYLTVLFLSKKRKPILIMFLILAIYFLPSLLPEPVIDRIGVTFTPAKAYKLAGTTIKLDESGVDRLNKWTFVFRAFSKSPIWGWGITSLGLFVEGEFVRLLGEVGMLGLLAFFWIIFRIFKVSLQNFQIVKDNFSKGIIVGFLAGLVGLLFHALTTNTFIIVRIMEPFWFLAAVVMVLPEISPS